jgi:hypothetical protein
MAKVLVITLANVEDKIAFAFPENSFGVVINLDDNDMKALAEHPHEFGRIHIAPAIEMLANQAVNKCLNSLKTS